MTRPWITVDGNEATARVAHLTNEVIAIYPITPASAMGESADAWTAEGRVNLWGVVPRVMEMQSEAGAAGTVHGALVGGALTTTFTASQGLLLMIPNMYKIAGELVSTVFHVASRSIATHALSIFGDHSDVMAARSTGWAFLFASEVQEAQDFACIAQAATLESRVPFVHTFDGFRVSHEYKKIVQLMDDEIRAMLPANLIHEHRERAMSPDNPDMRGSAQNPDVFFQAREAINPYYTACPDIVQRQMDKFAGLTGRQYHLFDYFGDPDAEKVIVILGSGAGAVQDTLKLYAERGEKVGVLKVRLYRPFVTEKFVEALPKTTKIIAAMDRCKEPGAIGEPLYQDVVSALTESWPEDLPMPRVIGGRYGLSSKEFNPGMVMAIFEEMDQPKPLRHFTIGINDDVSHLSLKYDELGFHEPDSVNRAVFYGLGGDGTIGANKSSIQIIGGSTDLSAQGYFYYDSKKAGSMTVSHLRFGPDEIHSSYTINEAGFVGVHQFKFVMEVDVLERAREGATLLINSPYGPDEVWDRIPLEIQQGIIDKKLRLFVVNADQVAQDVGLGGRINTVLQTCYFYLSGVLPQDEAINQIKLAIDKNYGTKGEKVLKMNYDAVDNALHGLGEVQVPATATSLLSKRRPDLHGAPSFVEQVTRILIDGKGELLPVSAMPVDGRFPLGTTKYEQRRLAKEIPIWDPSICIDCGLCTLVCPHAAIRMKPFTEDQLEGAPQNYKSKVWKARDLPDHLMTIQVAPEDCTGCSVCTDVCPAIDKTNPAHKSIDMMPMPEHLEEERANWAWFKQIREIDRTRVEKPWTVKGSQILEPLFEFSGACAGCGETPYLKLITQIYGERVYVANATGCSSIYGGNLPTTPWSKNARGRGPAWGNSLFEDNAEYGMGMRLAYEHHVDYAVHLLGSLSTILGDDLVTSILEAEQRDEVAIEEQRARIAKVREVLEGQNHPQVAELMTVIEALVRKVVWIVGGDGWAYDIGFGGLDHVLASGMNVNILVMDTEGYANTGGQASKATPRGVVTKFAASGMARAKKDLGLMMVGYGNIYVAQIAVGANPAQAIKAFHEAETYDGPSLIIAYSLCIEHHLAGGNGQITGGLDIGMTHTKDVVNSGYWPLYRYDPRRTAEGKNAFQLDSRKPSITFRDFAKTEGRYSKLPRVNPEGADELMDLAQGDIDRRWESYEYLAALERTPVDTPAE